MVGRKAGNEMTDTFERMREVLAFLDRADNPARVLARETSNFVIDPDDQILNDIATEHPSFPLIWSLMNTSLENLCRRNLAEDEFYSCLWGLISDGNMFGEEEDRTLALLCALSNPRLPYVRFVCPSMEDVRYETLSRRLAPKIRALRQIAARTFPQKTQEALAALSVIDTGETDEERAVMMAMLLTYVREIMVQQVNGFFENLC